jgi:hypothetical protein
MAAIRITLSEARDAITVRMTARGKSIQTTLDSVELDGLIAQLAKYRRALKAPHASHPQMDDASKGVLSAPWLLGDYDGRHRLLSYLHPGLGWLNFVLAPEDAHTLAKALLASKGTKFPDDPQFWGDV